MNFTQPHLICFLIQKFVRYYIILIIYNRHPAYFSPTLPSFRPKNFRSNACRSLSADVSGRYPVIPSVKQSVLLLRIFSRLDFSSSNASHHGCNCNTVNRSKHFFRSCHRFQGIIRIRNQVSHRVSWKQICCRKVKCKQIRLRLFFPQS